MSWQGAEGTEKLQVQEVATPVRMTKMRARGEHVGVVRSYSSAMACSNGGDADDTISTSKRAQDDSVSDIQMSQCRDLSQGKDNKVTCNMSRH